MNPCGVVRRNRGRRSHREYVSQIAHDCVPIKVSFNPAVLVPAVSISIVISSSAASAVVDRTAGVAAVSLVFSFASIVSGVENTDTPFLFTSICGAAPDCRGNQSSLGAASRCLVEGIVYRCG